MHINKYLLAFMVFGIATTCLVVADEDSVEVGEENIESEETFKEMISEKSVFVMFYAPWCGHCQRLKPTWQQLSEDINNDETVPMTVTRVDCTKNTKLCSDQGVMGYPTIKMYKLAAEEPIRHKGGRDVESLKRFIMDNVAAAEGEAADSADDDAADEKAYHVDGLYDLSVDNFNNHVASGIHFVKFFAPWCGHCKRMEPAWKELAQMHVADEHVKIGRVDCTQQKAVCTEHKVRGYPSLLVFKNGEKIDEFSGSRDLNALEEFVKTLTGAQKPEAAAEEAAAGGDDNEDGGAPSNEAIHIEGLYDLTADSFDTHVAEGDHFIKFFAPWCGHCRRLEPTWAELAKKQLDDGGDFKIGRVDCTQHQTVCGKFEVRGYPSLLYIREGKLVEKYQGGRDLKSFEKFINKKLGVEAPGAAAAAVGSNEPSEGLYQLTGTTFDTHVAKGHHFIKFYAPWCGHCKRMEPTWAELAKLHEKEGAKIAKIDCTEHGSTCSKFEVRGYPTLLYIRDGEKVEKYKGGRDLDTLNTYINGKTSDKNSDKPTASDEPVKAGEADQGLYDLTDDIFREHIAKGSHLVKFYAPWCGHCKRLEPTWKELAKNHLSKLDDDVKIARMDCTKNKDICGDYGIRGYPSILFFQNGEKVEKYQGSREVDKLEAYLQEKLSGEVVHKDPLKGVVYLHSTNFDFNVATDNVFVMFYAPWCAFCKKLKPIWLDLAKMDFKKGITTPVKIANVDCTKNAQICGQYKVTGYPTLILFVEGIPRAKYLGNRDAEALRDYVIEEVNKPAVAEPEPEVVEPEPEVVEPEPEVVEPEPEVAEPEPEVAAEEEPGKIKDEL